MRIAQILEWPACDKNPNRWIAKTFGWDLITS